MAISDHLTILSEDEISQLYDLPKIEEKERELFFEITPEDDDYLNKQTIVSNKINYLLQVGYFRATRNFYKFTFQQVRDNVSFIINQHYPESKFPEKNIDINKHYAAQKLICEVYHYIRSSKDFIDNLTRDAKKLTIRDLQSKFVFDELLELCEYYDIDTLQKINRKKARLYLICFFWQRFVKLNDHLTSFFVHKIDDYEEPAKTHAKNCVLEAKLEIDPARKTASKILKIIANHDIVPEDIRPNCYEIVEHIKIDENKLAWRLPYKKKEDIANNPFYKKIETLSLASGIDFTAHETGFFEHFSHILNKGNKTKPKQHGDFLLYNEIKRLSPVAWQHFNMLGTFIFCTSEKIINIHETAKSLPDSGSINAHSINVAA